MSLEQKKNEYLHYLLSTLRSSELDDARVSSSGDEHLERTYRRALRDYQLACEALEENTASVSKDAAELRERLDEKERRAERLAEALQKLRDDVAMQSSYANGRPFDMEMLDELDGQDLGEDLERARLMLITNKVDVSQVEEQLRKKNELSGGVSDAEYGSLEESIKRSEKKIESYAGELRNMNADGEKLLKVEKFLTTAINDYAEKRAEKEKERAALNDEIDDKRSYLDRLGKRIVAAKNEIGYDASDLEAFLHTRMVNEDFSSSKDELDKLRAQLSDLVVQHSTLVQSN